MGSAGLLRTQRRGKGSPRWQFPSHRAYAKIKIPLINEKLIKGKVIDIIYHYSHTAPLAKIKLENGEEFYIPASLGMYVGKEVEIGEDSKIEEGNILPLSKIPEGTKVYCIELRPGDGGKLVRSAGSYAQILSKEGDKVVIKLPSRKIKVLDGRCRAIIGIVAGGGRKEKPLIKAGRAYWYKRWKKHKNWPHTAASAMVARDHPFGGGKRRAHSPKTVSRRMPPGKKTGSIAARRTGKRKK